MLDNLARIQIHESNFTVIGARQRIEPISIGRAAGTGPERFRQGRGNAL
jgi:hypothetical protein